MRESQNPCNPNTDDNVKMETFHYEPPVPNARKRGIKRTAAYCRVSTLLEDQELSFETQSSYYSSLIENTPDMTLVGIYGDQGFSGLRAGVPSSKGLNSGTFFVPNPPGKSSTETVLDG